MKQFINSIFIVLFLSMASFAQAAKPTRADAELELSPLGIKLSNDGTGIIMDVTCDGCDYKTGKITSNTKAYVNGTEVNLLRARERAGKFVFIKFVRKTGEIMAIRWSE